MSRGLGPNQKKILKYLTERGDDGAFVLEICLYIYKIKHVKDLTDSQKNSVRKSINLLGNEYLDAIKFPYTGAHRFWTRNKHGKIIGWNKSERKYIPNYEKRVRLRKRPLKGYWKNWRTKC
jgi:hypothetical protein